MPQITLTASNVGYNLYTLLKAADPQTPYSCRGLLISVPPTAVVAANAGAIVKIGRPDSRTSPTAIANAEYVLQEAVALANRVAYPQSDNNNISLTEKWVNSTVNSTVLLVDVEQG